MVSAEGVAITLLFESVRIARSMAAKLSPAAARRPTPMVVPCSSGVLTLDEKDVTKSRVEASIEAASINTGQADRDTHLKSADFLDVQKFPALTFASTSVRRTGDGELDVEGNLTICAVTRKVTFAVEGPTPPVKDPWGNTRIGFSATTKINRKNFGLIWNAALETGGILVGDQVTITLEGEAVKA